MRQGYPIVFLWFLILFSCASEPAQDKDGDLAELQAMLAQQSELVENPQTPAEIFQNWQIHMDLNQFDEARKWSTPETKEWIGTIQTMIEVADAEDETVDTHLEGIQCREQGDTAICLFAEEAGDALRLDSIRLIKQGGNWKVDLWSEDERNIP